MQATSQSGASGTSEGKPRAVRGQSEDSPRANQGQSEGNRRRKQEYKKANKLSLTNVRESRTHTRQEEKP
nr:MAG TPA: hypothetical protein [Caudoviricetes sp.]